MRGCVSSFLLGAGLVSGQPRGSRSPTEVASQSPGSRPLAGRVAAATCSGCPVGSVLARLGCQSKPFAGSILTACFCQNCSLSWKGKALAVFSLPD